MGINAHRTLSDGRTLDSVMEFEHVVQVHDDGTVTDDLPNERAYWAPEVTWQNGTHHIDQPFPSQWSLMKGYSGQQGYSGPVMHPSEFIGGRMADDILSTPGLYIAVVVSDLDCNDSCEDVSSGHGEDNCTHGPAGWAVAHKPLDD